MDLERTFVAIKPDGVKRSLVGKIISRFEDVGLKVVAMKMLHVDTELAKQHYYDVGERHGDKVLDNLVQYITEGPVIAFVLEGVGVIPIVRKLVGSTYPDEAIPGTIRGDFSHISKAYANAKNFKVANLIHASANQEDADREIKLWFKPEEMHDHRIAAEEILFNR